jgi:hypothetical protein
VREEACFLVTPVKSLYLKKFSLVMLKKQENPVYKPLNHPASELAVIIYKAIGE